MDPRFSDSGQRPSYTNPHQQQQSACGSDFTVIDPYYTTPAADSPSPCLSAPVSGSMMSVHHQPRSSANPFGGSYTSNPQGPPPRSHMWASPPPGPDDLDNNNYSYHSSPVCGGMECYNVPPTSPASWSTPGNSFEQTADTLQHPHDAFRALRIGTPPSADEFSTPGGSQIFTPHTGSCFNYSGQGTPDGLPDEFQQASPLPFSDFSSGVISYNTSPIEAPLGTPLVGAMSLVHSPLAGELGDIEDLASPEALSPMPKCSSWTAQFFVNGVYQEPKEFKPDTPYAQLIYHAFMSRETHSMSLQEIYQWFRDRTEKGKSGSKGWQNSIRHNLSMNAAFSKCGSRSQSTEADAASVNTPASASTPANIGSGSTSVSANINITATNKRTTEWKLEDWAVYDGVQSTTRYRAKGASKTRGPGTEASRARAVHQQGRAISISPRAISGRRGGLATRRSRQQRIRRANQQQRHHEMMMMMAARGPYGVSVPHDVPHSVPHAGMLSIRSMAPPTMFGYTCEDLVADHHSHPSPEAPQTSPGPGPFGLMMPQPGLTHAAVTSGSSSCATYAVDQGQFHPMFPQPEFPYTVGDVTGVYPAEQHQVHIPQGVSEAQVQVQVQVPQQLAFQQTGYYTWNSPGM